MVVIVTGPQIIKCWAGLKEKGVKIAPNAEIRLILPTFPSHFFPRSLIFQGPFPGFHSLGSQGPMQIFALVSIRSPKREKIRNFPLEISASNPLHCLHGYDHH